MHVNVLLIYLFPVYALQMHNRLAIGTYKQACLRLFAEILWYNFEDTTYDTRLRKSCLVFRVCGNYVVSSPDPDSQQLRVDYITATWKVGLGNKNDALVPSVPKHWDGCVYT